MKQLANIIKEIVPQGVSHKNDDDNEDKDKKPWTFVKKDEDTSGTNSNYKKYLFYGIGALASLALLGLIYSNSEDIASTVSGIFHSSFEILSNYTWRKWFTPCGRSVRNPNPLRDNLDDEQDDEAENSSFVNSISIFFPQGVKTLVRYLKEKEL